MTYLKSNSKSNSSSSSGQWRESPYKCTNCGWNLPTKPLNGVLVKKWANDDLCCTCYAVDELIKKGVIVDNLKAFIRNLDEVDLIRVGHYIGGQGCDAMIVDMLTGLRIMRTGVDYDGGSDDSINEERDLEELRDVLRDVKASKTHLMIQLYKRF